jgi:hypothetical protein
MAQTKKHKPNPSRARRKERGIAMFEELLSITKKISNELQQKIPEEYKWYQSRDKEATQDIKYNIKIRDDQKQPNIARALASHIVNTECQNMVILAEQNLHLNYMARLSRSFELAITTIEKELSELKETATSTSRNQYDEKIKNLETNLKQLQQENDDMRPYYDAIRKAWEKQQKWLDAHK